MTVILINFWDKSAMRQQKEPKMNLPTQHPPTLPLPPPPLTEQNHLSFDKSQRGGYRYCMVAPLHIGPVLLATAAKLGIRQERGTRDKPNQ
jgi:hypothetical protein